MTVLRSLDGLSAWEIPVAHQRELIALRQLPCDAQRIRRTLGETVRCGRLATVYARGHAYCYNHGKRHRDEPDYERIRATHHD